LLAELRSLRDANLRYGSPTVGNEVRYAVPWRWTTDDGKNLPISFKDAKINCSPATAEAFLKMTRGDINHVPLNDKMFNGLYREWQGRGDRRGAVAVLTSLGIGSEVGINDIRPGDIAQSWNGDKGHSFVVGDVYRDQEGQVTGLLMVSANSWSPNRLKYSGTENAIVEEYRTVKPGAELYFGRLYDHE
jgi:hypothetical protein